MRGRSADRPPESARPAEGWGTRGRPVPGRPVPGRPVGGRPVPESRVTGPSARDRSRNTSLLDRRSSLDPGAPALGERALGEPGLGEAEPRDAGRVVRTPAEGDVRAPGRDGEEPPSIGGWDADLPRAGACDPSAGRRARSDGARPTACLAEPPEPVGRTDGRPLTCGFAAGRPAPPRGSRPVAPPREVAVEGRGCLPDREEEGGATGREYPLLAPHSPESRARRDKTPAPSAGVLSEQFRQRPTLPGSLPPSTIGAGGLNFRVRDGNGCGPTAMATGNQSSRLALTSTGKRRESALSLP